jgi:membrane-associated phospholipid phosphatase
VIHARATALALLLAAGPASLAAEPHPLRDDLKLDLAITGSALAFSGAMELLKDDLAAPSCRWCDPNALDARARRLLVLGYGERADTASDVLLLSILPATAAHQLLAARAAGDVGAGARDLLYIAEATAIAMSLTQLTKLAVGRERPFVHYGNHRDPARQPDPDDVLSFFSGHASIAFSLAAAAGTVSDLRGYPSAPWVWAVGLTLASGVGYLRIAADQHYLTDVLAGAAVGTAVGILVPRLLHPREKGTDGGRSAGVTFIPAGIGFAGVF